MGPLISKGHGTEARECPVGGLVVLTSPNWLELKSDTVDSKFLKNNLGKQTFYCLGYVTLGVFCKFFVATVKASLVSEGRLQV